MDYVLQCIRFEYARVGELQVNQAWPVKGDFISFKISRILYIVIETIGINGFADTYGYKETI